MATAPMPPPALPVITAAPVITFQTCRMLEKKDQTLIFKLACQYERLYDPTQTWQTSQSVYQFFTALDNGFYSATGCNCTNMPEQLRQQEQQWRGIFESPGYRAPEKWTKSTDPAEMWASVWIKTVHQKMKLAADARRAHHAVLAQIQDAEDAEAGRFDQSNRTLTLPPT
jgi:hypothetical protein